MTKTKLILIIVVCLASFGASLGVAWFTRSTAVPVAEANSVAKDANAGAVTAQTTASGPEPIMSSKTLSEKQLKLLIQSLRTKIADNEKKEQDLASREQQINLAKDSIAKDINELNNLRLQLTSVSADIKLQKEELDNFQMKITADELVNIKKTATIYDKMDVSSASKILMSMCMNKQLEDAVKILNYMSDRTAAKVIGEIGNADPKIAADLCQALKRIKETK